MHNDEPIELAEERREKQAPVNVKLKYPTEPVDNWDDIAFEWKTLNHLVGGNPGFYTLTIKAAYVIGVIHDICESVDCLIRYKQIRTTYLPAYGVFASGVEILGRCITGNETTVNNVQDIKTGFKWLASSSPDKIIDDYILIRTSSFEYTIAMLIALRHFAAHGQATSKKKEDGRYQFGMIDYEILEKLLPCLADGLDRYWHELIQSEVLCNKLAKANIIALRDWPIKKSWILFEKDKNGTYHSVADIFKRFNWRVSS
ncbi:MAG: hypothetical protein AB1589_42570 [Cyanobacteriota bacterium]